MDWIHYDDYYTFLTIQQHESDMIDQLLSNNSIVYLWNILSTHYLFSRYKSGFEIKQNKKKRIGGNCVASKIKFETILVRQYKIVHSLSSYFINGVINVVIRFIIVPKIYSKTIYMLDYLFYFFSLFRSRFCTIILGYFLLSVGSRLLLTPCTRCFFFFTWSINFHRMNFRESWDHEKQHNFCHHCFIIYVYDINGYEFMLPINNASKETSNEITMAKLGELFVTVKHCPVKSVFTFTIHSYILSYSLGDIFCVFFCVDISLLFLTHSNVCND